MSTSSKAGGGSRASDEDGKTSVKVGSYSPRCTAERRVDIHPHGITLLTAYCPFQSFVCALHSSLPTRASSLFRSDFSGRWSK